NVTYTRCAVLMRGSTSYFSQFSETFCCTTFTYQAYREPKSPPPPVKPKPPLAPLALNVPYGPLTGPPWPKGTTLSDSSTGSGFAFSLVALVFGTGLVFVILSGIGIASGSFSSTGSGLGSDCVIPFESLARTFWVWVGVDGSGMLLTRVTPMASPPPPAPQPSPWLPGATTA